MIVYLRKKNETKYAAVDMIEKWESIDTCLQIKIVCLNMSIVVVK